MNWLLRTIEALYRKLPRRCIWTLKAQPTTETITWYGKDEQVFRLADQCDKCGTLLQRDDKAVIVNGLVQRVYTGPVKISATRACSVSPDNWGSE